MADKTIRPTNIGSVDYDKTIRPSIGGENQVDKTIRPNVSGGNNADKTIRPAMGGGQMDKTIRPSEIGGGQIEKTVRPQQAAGRADKTVRPQMPNTSLSDKTMKAQTKEIERLSMNYEKEYVLEGKKYKFVKVLSEGTGEGDVYLVENSGKNYVLKLYYPGLSLPDKKVLSEVKSAGGMVGLVGLQSYGVWKKPNSQDERCYELMQYCEGGTLADYDLKGDEKKFQKMAVMMAMCINTCHQHGFLHCDVKPANFMFVDKAQTKLVLCDFGISIPCDKNGVAKNMSDARTRIYAAPEFYFSVPGADGREIYTSSDYYSLGMSLLCLWMGESAFKQQEAELMRLKIAGKLNYPPELQERTLGLLKALTVVDPQSRCGFAEIAKWAKGEDVFSSFTPKKESDIKSKFNIIFNAGKDQVAHSPEELAEFMYKEQALAIKYLYGGKLSKWLSDNLRPELATELEDIVEHQYPSSQRAGLFASCYVLDPSMPYYSLTGEACVSEQEIASAILHNIDGYGNALKDSSDLLYMFLRSQGFQQLVDQVQKTLCNQKSSKADVREEIRKLVYTLDPKQPFMYSSEDGDVVECNGLKDLIDAVRDVMATDETWEAIAKPSTMLWIGARDKGAMQRAQTMLKGFNSKNHAYQYGLIYSLTTAINYDLDWDKQEMYTYQHLASLFNTVIDARINKDKYSEDDINYYNRLYSALGDIYGTRLYFYLKSRGYDSWIKWIEACADTDSKDNQKKCAPYNMWIGVYKCIKGMGVDPVYYTASGKTLRTLRDVKALSRKELITETSEDRGLTDWLTVFFQEDPKLDLSKKFTFEKKTVEYVEFLNTLNPKIEEVERYESAAKGVKRAMSKVKRRYGGLITLRTLLALLCFVPLLALILTLCVVGLPFEGNPIEGHFWDVTVVCVGLLFIPMCFLTGLEGKLVGEAIISAIVGAVLYWVFYLLLKFLVPAAPYLIAALLLGFGIMVLVKCYIKLPLNRKLMKQLTDGGKFEEMSLEPLHYAYRTSGDEPFDSSIADDIEVYGDYLKNVFKRLLIYSIPTMAITAALFYLMVVLTPQIVAKQTSVNERVRYMVGTWTGKFDGKKSTIDIKEATAEKVVGYVHVKFSTMSNEKVMGSINATKKTMVLKDQVKNGVLDGTYNCKFEGDNFSKISGHYYNPKTGKNLSFEYSRELTKAEKSLANEHQDKSSWEIWLDIFKKKFNIQYIKKAA